MLEISLLKSRVNIDLHKIYINSNFRGEPKKAQTLQKIAKQKQNLINTTIEQTELKKL